MGTKFVKKMMAIYPMLLVLNHKDISLHLIEKWNRWKCHLSKDIIAKTVKNEDLEAISMKDILVKIKQFDKGIAALSPLHKLWICLYILGKGGKSFINSFVNHLQTEPGLEDVDVSRINIKKSALLNVYYNFCGYMSLTGQFPLSEQGKQALNKWWRQVMHFYHFQHRKLANIKMATPKRKRYGKEEKIMAIRDIISGQKDIVEYCTIYGVKEQTIIHWIKALKSQKNETQSEEN